MTFSDHGSQVMGPCPLGQCDHIRLRHDWEEPYVNPVCCVDGCNCGKGPTSTATEVAEVPESTGAIRCESKRTSDDYWQEAFAR